MDDKTFKLEIVTPHKVVFSDNVTHVRAPGIAGSFGVLANHTPFLTALGVGAIEVEQGKNEIIFATSGGYAEVMHNKMTVLVESAEEASEIDVERAKQARDRALKRLQNKNPDVDLDRAKGALTRALNRLTIASRK